MLLRILSVMIGVMTLPWSKISSYFRSVGYFRDRKIMKIARLDIILYKSDECTTGTEPKKYEPFGDHQTEDCIIESSVAQKLFKFHVGKKPSRKNAIKEITDKKMLRRADHFRFSADYHSQICLNLKSFLLLGSDARSGNVINDLIRLSVLNRFSDRVNKVFSLVRHPQLESPLMSDIADVLGCSAEPIRCEKDLKELTIESKDKVLIIEPMVMGDDDLLRTTVHHFTNTIEKKNIDVLIIFHLKGFGQKKVF